MLKARLYEYEIQKNEENQRHIKTGHAASNQILRIQPYQLVKDLRNKTESNPSSVLDGNIDQFIEEELKINNE